MLNKVKQWIETNRLLVKGDTVLAACSGGPDSLALLYILYYLQQDFGFTLAAGHVDHMFRGEESARDALFVAETCEKLGIPCYQTAIDVPEFCRKTGLSPEEGARYLRYRYLRMTAKAAGICKIATGHHRDDQAETVLLNLLRGAGSSGLGGMQPKEGDLIRPLLTVSRQEIEGYCDEFDLKPRFDSTNTNLDYTRNKIRWQLLPALEAYNPNIRESLCRTAEVVGTEQDFIRQYAKSISSQFVSEENGQTVIEIEGLAKQHLAVQREVLRSVLEKKRGNLKGITFKHVEQLLKMLFYKSVGSMLPLPGGLTAKKGYDTLKLGKSTKSRLFHGISYPGVVLAIPGRTKIPELNIVVETKLFNVLPKSVPSSAVFDAAALSLPVYVRTRREGDRFCPLGMKGHQKLKDFFINAKVLREKRDMIPIVADSADIMWLVGYRRAEHGKVSPFTKQFLQLIIEQGD